MKITREINVKKHSLSRNRGSAQELRKCVSNFCGCFYSRACPV